MEIKDLAGLSEPLKKLIEVLSQGVGALSKPYLIRKTADAKAYEIKVISKAIKANQQDLKQIGFAEEKLSLMSLDGSSIEKVLSIEERTQNRVEYQEQKRQKNIENITQKAAVNLESETTVSEEPVDEDWTTRFFKYAEDISNDEMQELWGRILAGEIKQPKSYSLRTLDILRNLSKQEAETFLKFASLAIHSAGTSFILNFNGEKLLEEKYGLKFNERLLLEELGFLTANDLVFKLGKTDSKPAQSVFIVGNKIVIYNKIENKPEQQLQILVFTKIGQELLKLVRTIPELDYIQLLATKINRENGSIKYGQILQELPNGQISHTNLLDVPMTEEEIEKERKRKEAENKK
jgi:uncharacterized repeat protein (TIGR03899 family)